MLLGRVALVAQWPIVVKLSRGRSVGLYSVGRSVCPVHRGKRRWDPDAVWHRRSDGSMDEAGSGVWFGDRCTEKGTFGDEFGARHCNQWGLYGVCVRQWREAALFPNYLGELVSIMPIIRRKVDITHSILNCTGEQRVAHYAYLDRVTKHAFVNFIQEYYRCSQWPIQ